ncbi:MAG: hypothetical protein ABNH26_00220 [Celeribacter sp.]|jgi:hypothetical protein
MTVARITCAAVAGLTSLIALPGAAAALSCLQPDPVRHYMDARDAPERYMAVLGRFTSSEPLAQPAPAPVPPPGASGFPRDGIAITEGVRFQGRALDQDGFDLPVDRPVSVALRCLGQFCATSLAQGEVIAYLKQTTTAPRAEVDPCGGWFYENPSPAQIDAVLRCHTEGDCVTGTGR